MSLSVAAVRTDVATAKIGLWSAVDGVLVYNDRAFEVYLHGIPPGTYTLTVSDGAASTESNKFQVVVQ